MPKADAVSSRLTYTTTTSTIYSSISPRLDSLHFFSPDARSLFFIHRLLNFNSPLEPYVFYVHVWGGIDRCFRMHLSWSLVVSCLGFSTFKGWHAGKSPPALHFSLEWSNWNVVLIIAFLVRLPLECRSKSQHEQNHDGLKQNTHVREALVAKHSKRKNTQRKNKTRLQFLTE